MPESLAKNNNETGSYKCGGSASSPLKQISHLSGLTFASRSNLNFTKQFSLGLGDVALGHPTTTFNKNEIGGDDYSTSDCTGSSDSGHSDSTSDSSESDNDSYSDSDSDSQSDSDSDIDIDSNSDSDNVSIFSCNDSNINEIDNSYRPLIRESVKFPSIDDCKENYVSLRLPNVANMDPLGVADMVNILTNPEALENFSLVEKSYQTVQTAEREGTPHPMYDYEHSETMKKELDIVKANCIHVNSARYGHAVEPGCISLYQYKGQTYAVAGTGKFYLTSVTGFWLQENISLDQPLITIENTNVAIIRVFPGEIGLVVENEELVMLDVGTHVFNSDSITVIGKDLCSAL